MVDLVLSPIAIKDLVKMIADEVESRIISNRMESLKPNEENLRFIGDRAIASYLDCTIQTIHKLKKAGKLPYHKYGRKYYYIQAEVDSSFNGTKK